MIKYDYILKRDEGNEKKEYKPTLHKDLKDLTIITAPNSSGKSTLLNILALGLFGNKNLKIRESLRNKIEALHKSSHQTLSYSYSIKNDKCNIELVSEKKSNSNDIYLFEIIDGKKRTLSFESFNDKYNLIYDIPENPLERFNELTEELRDTQQLNSRALQRLSAQVREYIAQVHESRDPNKIKQQRMSLHDIQDEIGEKQIELNTIADDINSLRQYYHLYCWTNEIKKRDNKQEELNNLKGLVRKQKKERKSETTALKTLYSESAALLIDCKTLYADISNKLSNIKLDTEHNYLQVWNKNDIKRLLIEENMRTYLFEGAKTFKHNLTNRNTSEYDPKKVAEEKLLKDMITLLNQYAADNIIIPGIDKHVNELKSILLREYRPYENISITREGYDKLILMLDQLILKSEKYVDLLKNIKELSKNTNDENECIDEDEYRQIKAKLQEELEGVEMSIEKHRDELIKHGIKESDFNVLLEELQQIRLVKPYLTYSPKDISAKLNELVAERDKIGNKLKECQFRKTRIEDEIQRLEGRQEHKYQHMEEELNRLLSILQIMEQKISVEYDDYLKKLKKMSINGKQLSKTAEKYYAAISEYLANKLKTVRHINKEYTVKSIDLIKREIVTNELKIIKFDDFGTGQGQSAYLSSLLNASDKRKMIAFIDEVAMLDDKSLRPVLNIIRDKYEEGKLLAAIVVQRGEDINMHSFVEGV